MSFSVNKVILVGNVGQNPEVKVTSSGSRRATFSLATTDTWKDKATNDWKSAVQWHRIAVLNDKLIDVVEKYIHKGSKLYVEGQLKTYEYKDKSDVKKTATEITISGFQGTIVLLDSKEQNTNKNDDYSEY